MSVTNGDASPSQSPSKTQPASQSPQQPTQKDPASEFKPETTEQSKQAAGDDKDTEQRRLRRLLGIQPKQSNQPSSSTISSTSDPKADKFELIILQQDAHKLSTVLSRYVPLQSILLYHPKAC